MKKKKSKIPPNIKDFLFKPKGRIRTLIMNEYTRRGDFYFIDSKKIVCENSYRVTTNDVYYRIDEKSDT